MVDDNWHEAGASYGTERGRSAQMGNEFIKFIKEKFTAKSLRRKELIVQPGWLLIIATKVEILWD